MSDKHKSAIYSKSSNGELLEFWGVTVPIEEFFVVLTTFSYQVAFHLL